MPLSNAAALRKDERNSRAVLRSPLTHRAFAVIAGIIRAMPTHAASLRTQRQSTARQFADKLASTNPRFDRARFLAACGEEETPA